MDKFKGGKARISLRAVFGFGLAVIVAAIAVGIASADDGWRGVNTQGVQDSDVQPSKKSSTKPRQFRRSTSAEQGPVIVPANLSQEEDELELPELDEEFLEEAEPIREARRVTSSSRVRRSTQLPLQVYEPSKTYHSSDYASEQHSSGVEFETHGPYDSLGSCDSCDDPWCGGCGGACPPWRCGPPSCLWVRGEYLLWWTKGMAVPPLVTTAPAGTPRFVDPNASPQVPHAGAIGQSGTKILFGGQDFFDHVRSGGRLTVGTGLDWCYGLGLEAEYFALGQDRERFSRSGFEGTPILAIPFFDVNFDGGAGGQGRILVSFDDSAADPPFVTSGTIRASANSSLQSYGVRFRQNICCGNLDLGPCCMDACGGCGDSCCTSCFPSGHTRWDFLFGYRSMRLDDSVGVRTTFNPADSNARELVVRDSFNSRNDFHGVDLGWAYEFERCRWSVDLLAKVAFGNNRQRVRITGSTVRDGAILPGFGGILAQPTNIGSYTNDHFSVIPEVGVTLGYALSCNVKLTAGYTFMYWTNVARAGEQIDFGVDSRLLQDPNASGANRPRFAFHESDFWAQGLNFGLQCRW